MSTLASQHWIMLKVKTDFNFFIPSGTESNLSFDRYIISNEKYLNIINELYFGL